MLKRFPKFFRGMSLARVWMPWEIYRVSNKGKTIKVGVAGASGYSGQEILKYIKLSPNFEAKYSVGRQGLSDEQFKELDLVFLCTPNEVSMEWAPKALRAGCNVIDLSGAFRLKEHSYDEWYGFAHEEKEWLQKSEYSLLPWQKLPGLDEIPGPRLIANPGCYATAVEMALIPLIKDGIINPTRINVDAKSGTTGAGRKGDTSLLFSELSGEFKPYKVGAHQHWPEIVESIKLYAGKKADLSFITELLPIERGISAAFFLEWADECPESDKTAEKLLETFQKYYSGSEDISVGIEAEFSHLKQVQRSNKISIQCGVAFGKPMVFSCIDNLGRGAAGQAMANAHALYSVELAECLK